MAKHGKFNKLKVLVVLTGLLIGIQHLSGQTFPSAAELAKSMTIGWNIGNTMEAIGGENAWGNPNVTQKLIDSVKAAGFNTIRIPCAWDNHANQSTLVIDAAWIARVKEVVDYCINRDMYVILNIHWDNGWLENNCTTAKQAEVNNKQNKYWTQIANYFKSYNEHLLFASANEPNVEDATQMSVLLSYHQTFINAVRATGGNNTQRILVVQGPGTDTEKTSSLMNQMPTDNVANKLMVEVHYYSPYQYCLMTEDASWGKMFYYWGKCFHSTTDATRNPTWGEESFLDAQFQAMKTKFVDKGIPVIIGEFAVVKRGNLTGANYNLHVASRLYYYRYISNAAKKYGCILCYWDAGGQGTIESTLFERNTGKAWDRDAINALMSGTYSSSTTLNCNVNDCKGVYNGNAYTNKNGECVLGYKATPVVINDCNGVPNGTAVIDNCGICTGGNTGKTACVQGPYSGSPSPVPGKIECENYDIGGNNIAFLDNTTGNTGGATFRTTEDVDIENCTDAEAGYNIGYATAGEWLEYTVNVASSGLYSLTFRVACNGDGRTISLASDGTTIANNIAIPNTAGWQAWVDVKTDVTLTAGQHVLRLTIGATDYVNLNYMTFTSAATLPPTVVSPVNYCQGATATALSATGTALKWYTVATGGTASTTAPTPSTATAGSTTYYVTQTLNSTESERASIVVNVTATPAAPPVTTPVNYTVGDVATALTATGTALKWYTVATGGTALASAPVPSTTTAATTNYYVSQTTGTCESNRVQIVVVVSPAVVPTVSLKAGWNLIGCPIDGSTNIANALSSIWPQVETVKNAQYYWHVNNTIPGLNTLLKLNWGEGYLIKVKANCELDWIVR